ncbi:MAG: ubiquitin-like domain-containing protein, partial [Acidimicrobiia bacterium]
TVGAAPVEAAPAALAPPVVVAPVPGPADESRTDASAVAALDPMIPAAYASVRPNRPAIVHRKRALRMRRRIIVTVLVTAVAAACAGVTARVLGGTRPQRDVTVSIDGQANTVVTRAGTVSDLLAAGGVVLHDGDRISPSLSTQLRQGMPIRVLRAFPFVVDVDGRVTARRTTRHTLAGIRRELGLPAAMVRVGSGGRIGRHSRVVLRTPHDVTVTADGATTPIAHSTALTVAELLAGRKIALGAQDEVTPALDTQLSPGLAVQVFRLLPGQVVDLKVIPFTTQYQDDPNLARGHTTTIQAGKNGTARVVSNVVKKDGVIYQWTEVSSTVVTPPVTQILARGTRPSGTQQPPPAPATGGRSIGGGYATWYASHAGPGACAHLTLPFGTIVKLVADNGRTAQCRVGDRGPEAWTGNIIDLNPDVFAQLAPLGTGRIHVSMYVVG